MGSKGMKERTPIILQYFGDVSIHHLGGIAVYPNEFNRVLSEIQEVNDLDNNLRDGRLLIDQYRAPFRDKAWQLLLGAIKRISNSPFSFISSFLFRFIESRLTSHFGKYESKRPDVIYHHMNNFVFPDYTVIRIARKFNVLMVSNIVDLLEVDFPQYLPRSTILQRKHIKNWLSKTTNFFVPITKFIEEDSRAVGLVPINAKVAVISWGADHIAKRSSPTNDNSLSTKIVKSSESSESFFLFPAKAWKHKGHVELIEAYYANDKAEFRIVLIGDLDPLEIELESLLSVTNNSKAKNISLTGFVDRATKDRLFADCKAVILPSCYEGFGFPYFEAAFLRKPFVAFKTKSYLEFFGSADTDSVVTNQDFAAFVNVLINFDVQIANMEAATRFNSIHGLTWSDCVGKTLSVYRQLLEEIH